MTSAYNHPKARNRGVAANAAATPRCEFDQARARIGQRVDERLDMDDPSARERQPGGGATPTACGGGQARETGPDEQHGRRFRRLCGIPTKAGDPEEEPATGGTVTQPELDARVFDPVEASENQDIAPMGYLISGDRPQSPCECRAA